MFWLLLACTDLQSGLMSLMPLSYSPPVVAEQKAATWTVVVEGLTQVTDIQFLPQSTEAFVTLKSGELSRMDVRTGQTQTIASLQVQDVSEMGLLSVAIHPNFSESQKLYLHFNPKKGENRTEIAEFQFISEPDRIELRKLRTLFEWPQPFPNHNGGAIRFGPDGHLYVGLGDGGWRYDPKGNGQNVETPLGGLLRLAVDDVEIIPQDNPFIASNPETASFHPLLWATGIRNPWKFTHLPDGRVVVADVGQNAWEEISLVDKGDNLGWNVWEGFACVEKDCPTMDKMGRAFRQPIYVYDHSVGQSITGGVLIPNTQNPARLDYIFGDFVTGRIWRLLEIDAPRLKADQGVQNSSTQPISVIEVAQTGSNISTFAKDDFGGLYFADFSTGRIFQLGE